MPSPICACRRCGTRYPENRSRATYKGYCTAACLHEAARRAGYKPNRTHRGPGDPVSEYDALKARNAVGSVFVHAEDLSPESDARARRSPSRRRP